MQKQFTSNLNVSESGMVAAAPQNEQQAGDQFQHWSRDAALSQYSFMQLNDFELSKIESVLDKYTEWVQSLQNKSTPHNIDIRVEVKYEIPTGDVYAKEWCRPQNDAPGLRAITFLKYATLLVQNGWHEEEQQNKVHQYWNLDSGTGGIIPFDLDYIAEHWRDTTCDLWEEITSNSLFWNLYTTRNAMEMGIKFADVVKDSERKQKYEAVLIEMVQEINTHYNGRFIQQDTNRQIDSSVITALNVSFMESYHGDTLIAVTDVKVAQTVLAFNDAFCDEYPINAKDDSEGIPGILYGRYVGDIYKGGNPWVLSTASLAQLFYNIAYKIYYHKQNLTKEEVQAWSKVIQMPFYGYKYFPKMVLQLKTAVKFINAGDSVMKRIYAHVSGADFHLYEQLDKFTGFETSAADLTWSQANVLNALKTRNDIMDDINIHKYADQLIDRFDLSDVRKKNNIDPDQNRKLLRYLLKLE